MPNTPIAIKKDVEKGEHLPGLWRSFREELDHLFHRFDGGFGLPGAKRLIEIEPFFARAVAIGALMPKVDVVEDDHAYSVTVELPGLDEKDMSVTLTGNHLLVKGTKIQERGDKDLHIRERSYGAFERSFRIPDSIEREKIAADFSKGVLTITLPKSASATQPAKKIEIKAA